ncbi:hypothetical protein FRC17_006079, partial [Serendipita sp. 399]
ILVDNMNREFTRYVWAYDLTRNQGVMEIWNAKLHPHDIGNDNTTYHKVNGRIVAVLIDFDFVKDLEDPSQPTSRHRSGTVPFMASSLLSHPNSPHTLHEDFESACYILVWTALGYRGSALPEDKEDPLANWKNGSLSVIAAFKMQLFADARSWESLSTMIVKPYEILREPIARLRRVVRRYHDSRELRYDASDFVPNEPTVAKYLDILCVVVQ